MITLNEINFSKLVEKLLVKKYKNEKYSFSKNWLKVNASSNVSSIRWTACVPKIFFSIYYVQHYPSKNVFKIWK